MDCVACIDETTTGPVSPNRYYHYSRHVGRPLTGYRYGRVFAPADVVEEISLGALPICGDSDDPSGPTASMCLFTLGL